MSGQLADIIIETNSLSEDNWSDDISHMHPQLETPYSGQVNQNLVQIKEEEEKPEAITENRKAEIE